ELPLEIVLPKAPPPRTVAAPMTQPSVDPHPLHDLRQHRRAAMAPQIWARGIMTALGVVAALFAIVIWWTHEPTPPGRAVVTRPRAVITLANLPEEAFVWLDGTRTFLNPIEMPIDSNRHEIRIECRGYRPKKFGVVPTADQTFDASLEKEKES